jgi:hypothetical protein
VYNSSRIERKGVSQQLPTYPFYLTSRAEKVFDLFHAANLASFLWFVCAHLSVRLQPAVVGERKVLTTETIEEMWGISQQLPTYSPK